MIVGRVLRSFPSAESIFLNISSFTSVDVSSFKPFFRLLELQAYRIGNSV